MKQRLLRTLLMHSLLILMINCQAQPMPSAWIKPINKEIDLKSLRLAHSEKITLLPSPEGMIPMLTPENEGRGDVRTYFQNKISYASLSFANFLGTLNLTFHEIPFHNTYALSLQIGSLLWDTSRKRSREFLPPAQPSARLLFVQDPSQNSLPQAVEPSILSAGQTEYPMRWDGQQENPFYEAFLTPKELDRLQDDFQIYPQGRLYLNIGDRNYDITTLKPHVIKNITSLRTDITKQQSVDLTSSRALSHKALSTHKLSSSWMPLSSLFVKVRAFHSLPSTSHIELILGSYDATPLRNIFAGNTSLIFCANNQIFLLPFNKTSFFSTLQHKKTALLSFATIPLAHHSFFETSQWKEIPKEFWQINLISYPLLSKDLTTIKQILENPSHTVSLSLHEEMFFFSGPWLTYTLNLFKALYTLKTTQENFPHEKNPTLKKEEQHPPS